MTRAQLLSHFLGTALAASIFALGFYLLGTLSTTPPTNVDQVRVTAPTGIKIDYRPEVGRWFVGGEAVDLDCPTEDTCQVQVVGSGQVWIYKH